MTDKYDSYDYTRLPHINGVVVEEIDKRSIAARLEAQAQRLLDQAQKMRDERERFGEDDYPDQAVITFDKVFPTGTKVYHYAAMKKVITEEESEFGEATELWYTTGPKAPKGYTWDELVNWMGKGVKEIYYVTEMKKVVG
jgi:hypothetical protein